MSSTARRWILIACTLALAVTVLDDTVVYLALPALAEDLEVGLAGQQWVVNAYLMTLASFLLVGGTLGDRYGRRRLLLLGTALFTIGSMGAAAAPSHPWMVVARGVEGVGAAWIMPNTLAILRATFHGPSRARAIGQWSAYSGIAAAIGPPLAGGIIVLVGWRPVFLLSVPVSAWTAWLILRYVQPDPPASHGATPVDWIGAALDVALTGSVAYALIEAHARGLYSPDVAFAAVTAVIALPLLWLWGRRADPPLVPPQLLRDRQVTAANLSTFTLYGAYHGSLFLVIIYLQAAIGFSALQTGLAVLPVTGVLLVVAPAAGRWTGRIGARWPAAVGQALAAAGMAWLAFLEPGDRYLSDILPPLTLFAIGFGFCIPALTHTAVSRAPEGVASMAAAVNTIADRLGALFFIALIGLVFRTTYLGSAPDSAPPDPQGEAYVFAFRVAILTGSGFAGIGAVLSAIALRSAPRRALSG